LHLLSNNCDVCVYFYFSKIFSADGPSIDAASCALYVALRAARLPQVQLVEGEAREQGPDDFEVVSDMAAAKALPLSKDGPPIVVTSVPVSIST
jgi:exosome complex RNA-binding protein Rrp42 (RNase PH superfamily)